MEMGNLKWLATTLVSLGLLACSPDVRFSESLESEGQQEPTPEDSSQDGVVRCEPGQITVVKPTKVLFVVDQSGSNVNGPFGFPYQPTDADKSFRSGVIEDFYRTHGDKPYLGWGFITFNGTSAQGLIHDGDPMVPVFSNQTSKVEDAFDSFLASEDVGNTPYKAALTMIRAMIEMDMTQGISETQYLVAFITDGYPTDYCSGGPSVVQCPDDILEDKIDKDLQKIMKLGKKRIQFSTVYYGLLDNSAATRLDRMAKLGNGQFVDANENGEIKLEDVLKIPREVCQ